MKIFAQGEGVVGDRWVNPVSEDPEENTETIAVQVFDKYGNALGGYKVTWEIVGQGTVTASQIPTYHPYAHFEDANHDLMGLSLEAAQAAATNGLYEDQGLCRYR